VGRNRVAAPAASAEPALKVVPRKAATKKRAPRKRILTQTFYLEGGVEVTIRFPEGAARWQSTQSTVSIATGTQGLSPLPSNGQVAAVASVPVQQDASWSNCDTRGLGAVAGLDDPKRFVRAPGVRDAEPDPISSFLDRVEKNVIRDEIGENPNEELTGGESDEELQEMFSDA
jgi:hypothetical protein